MESNPTTSLHLLPIPCQFRVRLISSSFLPSLLFSGDVDDLARLRRGEFRQIEEERDGNAAEPNSTDELRVRERTIYET